MIRLRCEIDAAIPVDGDHVSKCMERAPRRYDSAKALAEDLGHFIDGTRIEARGLWALGATWPVRA